MKKIIFIIFICFTIFFVVSCKNKKLKTVDEYFALYEYILKKGEISNFISDKKHFSRMSVKVKQRAEKIFADKILYDFEHWWQEKIFWKAIYDPILFSHMDIKDKQIISSDDDVILILSTARHEYDTEFYDRLIELSNLHITDTKKMIEENKQFYKGREYAVFDTKEKYTFSFNDAGKINDVKIELLEAVYRYDKNRSK